MTDDLERSNNFQPKFDENGLMPATAIEQSTGTPLMLAYVNEGALIKSLETGYAHFWSRSRQNYWQKGETSGNRLKIIDILIDCDQDSLCFIVEMEGLKAACHTGRKTCYYRKLTLSTAPDTPLTLSFTDAEQVFDPKKIYKK